MKKVIRIVLWSVLALVLVVGVLMWIDFAPLVKGAMSCKQLDDGLYYIEYKGDDGFDELMARGGMENADQLAAYAMEFLSRGHYKPAVKTEPAQYGCSALTVATPEGGILMGRNFDFPSAIGVIMHTIPDRGYESITTFNALFYGFGDDYKPEGFLNGYRGVFDTTDEKSLNTAPSIFDKTAVFHTKKEES